MIEELKNRIRDCKKCELCKLMPFKPVPGLGPDNADIFIICEALGKDEALVEEPFVGLRAKFLAKCLSDAQIDITKCYITNVVKCSPTNNNSKNRPPNKEEIVACYDWLVQEIHAIKPKIIIGLGKIATEFLYSKKVYSLSEDIGILSEKEYYPCKFICTYHPNYLLQHGKKKIGQVIEHFKIAKRFIDGV